MDTEKPYEGMSIGQESRMLVRNLIHWICSEENPLSPFGWCCPSGGDYRSRPGIRPHFRTVIFLAVLIMAVSSNPKKARAQSPWWITRQVAAELRENGVARETDRAMLWFEPGVLSDEQINEFAELVNCGVLDIEETLKIEPRRDVKIRFFISSKGGISQTMGRTIFLPIERVANRTAPYLHETTHAVAPCPDCPMWFSEGLASYVQSYISENVRGYDGAVFTRRGNRGIDHDAARWIASDRGQAVLPFLGTHEQPPQIAYDRSNVAAPYYVMSQSLIKFMVEKIGMEKLREVWSSSHFEDTLVSVTGKDSEAWKEDWLEALVAAK